MGTAFNRNIRQGDLNGMRGGSTSNESVERMSQGELPVNEMNERLPEMGDEDEMSIDEEQEMIFMDSLFGIMGEYGNNIMIYSSDSIILKHQINVG